MSWTDNFRKVPKEASWESAFDAGAAVSLGGWIMRKTLNKMEDISRFDRKCYGRTNCKNKAPLGKEWSQEPETGAKMCPSCKRAWYRRKQASEAHYDNEFDRATYNLNKVWNEHVPGDADSHKRVADALARKARATPKRNKKLLGELWDAVVVHNNAAKDIEAKKKSETSKEEFNPGAYGLYPVMCKNCGHIDSSEYMRDGVCDKGVGCDD